MNQQTSQKKSYKSTLNLPKSTFSMKANLVQNEPASMKRWSEMKLYQKIRQARQGRPHYSFHDGPPYANGSIHLGHLLNKVLKDVIVRWKTLRGFDCPYVPGWDCHGLPIEHKVAEQLGPKSRELSPIDIRRRCRKYAEKFIKLQSSQMQRLLTLADYDHPYLTMNPPYEAAVLEVFARLVEAGLVFRGLKPVHWSIQNQTALADAELEYEDRQDTSIYVLFELADDEPLRRLISATGDPSAVTALMIWTTTPWTLPANRAVAVHEKYDYGLYRFNVGRTARQAVIARELAAKVLSAAGGEFTELARFSGRDLVGMSYRHPFVEDDRQRPVVAADYVTLEDGTGLVHIAPGHGMDDYLTAIAEGLEIYCPVQDDGTFSTAAPEWLSGIDVWSANDRIVGHLRDSGHLFHDHTFTHSYPHDWRGKSPVIFRATKQWFIAVDKPATAGDAAGRSLRDAAMDVTADQVQFYPKWGQNRMRGMIESRPDWCLSRQRAWGLPIPAFFNEQGEPLLTAASIRAVARFLGEHGSDAWFQADPADLLKDYDPHADPDAPKWLNADPGTVTRLGKSTDIFDVWFESGSSWNAVMKARFGDEWFPADLYLEGSDQHRGWFQLSLLPALGATGDSPFKNVLTHGFMVDKHGHKMSKSDGNTIEVEGLLKDYGADVCRWWISSLNTDNDIKADNEYFKIAGEEYRKVRNTIRYLLSNLGDFDPPEDTRTPVGADPTSLDAWALGELNQLIRTVAESMDSFHLRRAHEALFHFCNHTLSAVYLAATKDRLYCDRPDSPRRRRTQTALYRIVDDLIRLLAVFIPHTADEAWRALHGTNACVHLEMHPARVEVDADPQWAAVMAARDVWLKAIEDARQSMGMDNPLDCGLLAPRDPELGRFDPIDLADLCGISRFEWTDEGASPHVLDLRSELRCERCWKRDGTVKQRRDGGMLSDRDAEALGLQEQPGIPRAGNDQPPEHTHK